MKDIDRILHEPARLWLMIYLHRLERADFTFLRKETGMTQGNLSSHLGKLELAGYIRMEKSFSGKRPLTLVSMTAEGRKAYETYVCGMEKLFADLVKGITC